MVHFYSSLTIILFIIFLEFFLLSKCARIDVKRDHSPSDTTTNHGVKSKAKLYHCHSVIHHKKREIYYQLERLQKALDGDIRDIVSKNRKEYETIRKRRSKRSVVDTYHVINSSNNRRCGLFIHADHSFVLALQQSHIMNIRRYIFDTIKTVNGAFSRIDFNQDQQKDNFTFYIDKLVIDKVGEANLVFDDAYHHLERISLHNHSNYCLAYYLTSDQRYNVHGLSWIGTANKNTGLCSSFNYHHQQSQPKSMNTGLINFNIHHAQLFPYVFVHELAHSLGAVHDSETRCKQYATTIPFFMSGIIMNITEIDQMRFSPCSIQAMAKVIKSRSTDCLRANVDPTRSTCGNKIIESDEQCDCGTIEECQDHCCNPATCQLAQNAICSPSQGPCCNSATCHYFTQQDRHLCQNETQCSLKSYCNGQYSGSTCPKATFKDDYTVCDGRKSCVAGTCQQSVCSAYKFVACTCPNHNNTRNDSTASSSSCSICCRSLNSSNTCSPLQSLVEDANSLIYDICQVKSIQHLGALERQERNFMKSILDSLLGALGVKLLGFIISNLGLIRTLGLILASSAVVRTSLIGFILTPIILITLYMQRYRLWFPCHPISCGLDRHLAHRYCALLRAILKLFLFVINIFINCYIKIVRCCCSNEQRRLDESFYFKMIPKHENSVNLRRSNSVPQRRHSSTSIGKPQVTRRNSISRCNTNASQPSNINAGSSKWPTTSWKNLTSSISGLKGKCKKTTNNRNKSGAVANKHSFEMSSHNYPSTNFRSLNRSDTGNKFGHQDLTRHNSVCRRNSTAGEGSFSTTSATTKNLPVRTLSTSGGKAGITRNLLSRSQSTTGGRAGTTKNLPPRSQSITGEKAGITTKTLPPRPQSSTGEKPRVTTKNLPSRTQSVSGVKTAVRDSARRNIITRTQSCYNRSPPPMIPKRPSSFRHNSCGNVRSEGQSLHFSSNSPASNNNLNAFNNKLNRGTESRASSSFRGGISTSERVPTGRRSSYQDDNKNHSMTNLNRQPSTCRPSNSGTLERSSIERLKVNKTPSLPLNNTSTLSRKKSNGSLSLRRPPPPMSSNKLNSSGDKIRPLSHRFSSLVNNDRLPHSHGSNTDTVASFNQSNIGYFNGKGTSTPLSRVHNNLQQPGKASISKNIFSPGLCSPPELPPKTVKSGIKRK